LIWNNIEIRRRTIHNNSHNNLSVCELI
jgi:hypothetical protein